MHTALAMDHALPNPRSRHASRILLLTASLGAGHARAAAAVAAALRAAQPGCAVRTQDFWSLMDEAVAASLQRAYLNLVRDRTGLYDRIYRLDQRTWRAILAGAPLPEALLEGLAELAGTARQTLDEFRTRARHPFDRLMLRSFCGAWDGATRLLPGAGSLLRVAIIRSGWTLLARRLDAVLREFEPDAIVSTQMNPAALLALCARRRRAGIPSIGVITDYGVHDFWLQPGVDRYCLPHADVPLRLDRGEAGATVTGIPLMPPFAAPPERARARACLGIDQQMPVVLVVGGGLGIGVEPVARALLASPRRPLVLVVTGRDVQAAAHLHSHRHERLRLWTWTAEMALLMRAADIVVGKPGGLTVAESLACGRPLLATGTLHAQEDFNLQFLRRHAVGDLVLGCDVAGRVESMFDAPARLRAMQAHAWELGHRNGAARVAALALDLADAHRRHRVLVKP